MTFTKDDIKEAFEVRINCNIFEAAEAFLKERLDRPWARQTDYPPEESKDFRREVCAKIPETVWAAGVNVGYQLAQLELRRKESK